MKLSKRAQKAIELMKAGAFWRNQLETVYPGNREQFKVRLRDSKRNVIPGYGFRTYDELEKAGKLQWRECSSSSTWPSEYVLKE